jgi:hypothetical protein
MKVIDLSPKEQEILVSDIRAEIQSLQKQKKKIEGCRDQIDEIIIKSLNRKS